MEYFYSHIAENDLNRDFIDALRNYAEEVKEQIYLLQHPLTDSKYSYEDRKSTRLNSGHASKSRMPSSA